MDTKIAWRPIQIHHPAEIQHIKNRHPELTIVDQYEQQLEDVFLLRHPQYRFNHNYQKPFQNFVKKQVQQKTGNWFYFPWLNSLIHVLPENLHLEMRTGRNRNLITKEEQRLYYNGSVGILGMSVGSHAALTIAMTGGPKHLFLADPDTLAGSNLNRIRTGIQNIAVNKTVLVARQIFEINPYADIKIYPEGISDKNYSKFVRHCSLLIEAMDNLYWKIKIREVAKSKKIPVIMATDNGDNIFVDIERFDTEKNLPLLNGRIGKITAEQFKNLDPKELPKTAAKIAGAEMATLRMQQSVLEVGKTLYSWPQLGTAANLCGSALAYLTRKLMLKADNIKSGRYQINLEQIFESDYNTPAQRRRREKQTKKFLKRIRLTT